MKPMKTELETSKDYFCEVKTTNNPNEPIEDMVLSGSDINEMRGWGYLIEVGRVSDMVSTFKPYNESQVRYGG